MKPIQTYTKKRLYDYALWYYFRYYPSNAHLFDKLLEKGTVDDTTEVYKDIQHLLIEDEILQTKINTYLTRNKNYSYIYGQLYKKKFPKEKIESALGNLREIGESLLQDDFLYRKIQNLISKGKSQREIIQKLGETPKDREKIYHLFENSFPDSDSESLPTRIQKIQGKYSKEKIIQKLISEGFNYRTIKNYYSND